MFLSAPKFINITTYSLAVKTTSNCNASPLMVQPVKNVCNAGDSSSIPGSGRFPGDGYGNPLQYSCLGNPMDRGAWWATALGVTELDVTEQLSMHGI